MAKSRRSRHFGFPARSLPGERRLPACRVQHPCCTLCRRASQPRPERRPSVNAESVWPRSAFAVPLSRVH